MKKTVLVLAVAFGLTGAFAQDLTSKKGEPILPEANDWAISLNADPVFQFIGNAFRSDSIRNSPPGVGWLNSNQTIVGKKFIDEKSAYRVLVRIGYLNQSFKNSVTSNAMTVAPVFPADSDRVVDKFSHKNTNIAIGVGKEMRRGKTRLQGFYGADVMIWISATSDKYTYGNTMSAQTATGTTTSPYSTTWDTDPGSSDFGTGTFSAKNSRVTLDKKGLIFGIGIRGFIGAEYFMFPKIAIGAEYGWGIGFQTQGKGKVSTEKQGGSPNQVAVTDNVSEGNSKFGIDTDLNQEGVFGFKGSNTGGVSLKVTFHF